MAESYTRCRYEIEGGDEIRNGLVTINGPKATLWRWSTEHNRYEILDRITKLKRAVTNDTLTLMGTGQGLEPIIVHVTPRKCRGCS